ncbi:DUF4351 domain-containing protein, partial [Trichormus variabilis PNB]
RLGLIGFAKFDLSYSINTSFPNLVLETPLVQQIMRWDMAILRESPWYQEILAEGEQRGLQQGLQQGMQRQLIRLLQRRFGEVPQELAARLEGETVERLENLMDSAIAVSSLAEFQQTYSLPK